jgi:hypothetical protein
MAKAKGDTSFNFGANRQPVRSRFTGPRTRAGAGRKVSFRTSAGPKGGGGGGGKSGS